MKPIKIPALPKIKDKDLAALLKNQEREIKIHLTNEAKVISKATKRQKTAGLEGQDSDYVTLSVDRYRQELAQLILSQMMRTHTLHVEILKQRGRCPMLPNQTINLICDLIKGGFLQAGPGADKTLPLKIRRTLEIDNQSLPDWIMPPADEAKLAEREKAMQWLLAVADLVYPDGQ